MDKKTITFLKKEEEEEVTRPVYLEHGVEAEAAVVHFGHRAARRLDQLAGAGAAARDLKVQRREPQQVALLQSEALLLKGNEGSLFTTYRRDEAQLRHRCQHSPFFRANVRNFRHLGIIVMTSRTRMSWIPSLMLTCAHPASLRAFMVMSWSGSSCPCLMASTTRPRAVGCRMSLFLWRSGHGIDGAEVYIIMIINHCTIDVV